MIYINLTWHRKGYTYESSFPYCLQPTLQALSLKESDEVEDDLDDAAHEATEAQRAREKAVAKFHKAPKPLDEGGGT